MSRFIARILGTKVIKAAAIASMLGMIAVPATAQFSDSYNFLKAVKERKGEDATRLIEQPGSGAVLINTRDITTGQGALHIVVERRDAAWLSFLLQKGANPNIADKKNVTPLMLSTQLGFKDGVEWLIKYKANIDQTNRGGETALIMAVNLRNSEMVRVLLKNGANPDKKDSVAGLSAREYALRDGRGSAISGIIESETKTSAKKPKDLDFTGVK
jgi:uncharacterized protein